MQRRLIFHSDDFMLIRRDDGQIAACSGNSIGVGPTPSTAVADLIQKDVYSTERRTMEFTVRHVIEFSALDRLVDYLNAKKDEQSSIDQMLTDIQGAKNALHDSSNSLNTSVGEENAS